MARDARPAPPRGGIDVAPKAGRAGSGRGGINPLFAGIIIGLLLGVGLALGLAIWLNRANTPFVEKERPVDALPTIPAKPASPPAAAKADADKPRFDFYQILPGEKSTDKAGEKADKPEKSEKAAKAEPHTEKPVAPPVAAAKPEPAGKLEIKPASSEVFMLQAGAFQNQTDAENMRAKVAFAGFEASVKPVNLPDKGTLYRVRLGPYKSLDEVNRIKTVLSQSGIGAAVVKGTD
jgi:cell division protein FtsN